jgi:hypothetical protein
MGMMETLERASSRSFPRSAPAATRQAALAALAIATIAVTLAAATACGDDQPGVRVVRGDGDDVSFGDNARVVVTDEGTFIVTGRSDECVVIEKYCVDIDQASGRYCGEPGAQADVIVVDGEVAGVICYPPDDAGTPIEEVVIDNDGNPTIPQNQNGLVIIFDESTNGTVLEGNLTMDAERTTIYGNGVDETFIGGNITAASNNSRVRGLTVQGNVVYEDNSNNSALSFCRIHGNLQVHSNGFTGLQCVVFGNVQVSGNGAVLVNIGVGGDWQVTGSNPVCSGCYSIDDDGDFQLEEGEAGPPVDCD